MLSRAKHLLEHVHTFFAKMICPGWGSNSRPSDYETDALPTALPRQLHTNLSLVEKYRSKRQSCKCLKNASAGNRTRINCLEGSYAHHYTTDATCLLKKPYLYSFYFLFLFLFLFFFLTSWIVKMFMPWPGFEPGLLRPQRRVLTTRRSWPVCIQSEKCFVYQNYL